MAVADVQRSPAGGETSTPMVKDIVDRHRGKRGALLSVLQDVQSRYGYLSREALELVAEGTGRSLADVFGVATFYRAFSLKPRGKHVASVCVGTACHVRGAPMLLEEFERQLKTTAGETTADREFTLETVNCLGACALGPIVVTDGRYHSRVKTTRVKQILKRTREASDGLEVRQDPRIFPVDVSCAHCNHRLLDSSNLVDEHPSIRVTIFFEGKHGWLRLSSLYGSFNIASEFDIPQEAVVDFFCPHCHAEMRGGPCMDCGASMVPMIVRGGGMVQICSRRGCHGHMLDLSGVNL